MDKAPWDISATADFASRSILQVRITTLSADNYLGLLHGMDIGRRGHG